MMIVRGARPWLGLLLLLVCNALLPSGLEAQSRVDLERAESSFRAGAAAYAAGDYAAAIQALDMAYAITPLPAIAFSLAQAERRFYFLEHGREHLERAIRLFRLYLAQVPSGGRRTDALDAISQLEPLLSTLAATDPAVQEALAPNKPTRLMITCDAPAASISLDGQPPAPSPLIREVTPGKHRIAVEARGFDAASRDVTALAGELILNEISLKPRPSQLVVIVPEDADVYIDGQYMSQGPKVSLTLPAGPHQLAVASRGRRVVYRDLSLQRGASISLNIALERTRQRRLARGLFIAGGVGFGASLALAIVALRAQGQAQDFLARRERDNVSSAELAAYQDDVDLRDRLRIATDATLAASAALFVTGLILHQVDRPNPREIHRHAQGKAVAGRFTHERDSQADRAPIDQARPISFSPWATRHIAGVSLRVGF
jgi:tetratricopeptide (TPR) repeat protein